MAHIPPSPDRPRRSLPPINFHRDVGMMSQRDGPEASYGVSQHHSSPIGEHIMGRLPAPLGTPETNHSVLGHTGQLSQRRVGASMQTEGARDFICICPPEIKIPRPRNAFILYRQHHHTHVTAENPRLSNPQISKIIATQWKTEIPHIKDDWRRLSDEEKMLHKLKYPFYQYKPRRGKKRKSSGSAAEQPHRCPKCHGRLMATPRTPRRSSARLASGNSNSEPQPRPSLPMPRPPMPHPPLPHPPMPHLPMPHPPMPPLAPLNTDFTRRESRGLYQINSLSMQGRLPFVHSPEAYEPASPQARRRRTDGPEDYHLASGRFDFHDRVPATDSTRMALDGGPTKQAWPNSSALSAFASMPRSQSFPSQPSFTMQPTPPRPWERNETGGYSPRASLFDNGLRLPPIQMPISPSPSRASMGDNCETGAERGNKRRRIWE